MIPGLCRTAVEAAFTEAYWRAELRRGPDPGRDRGILASRMARELNLRGIAALALFGDADGGGNVLAALEQQWGPAIADTYGRSTRAPTRATPVTSLT